MKYPKPNRKSEVRSPKSEVIGGGDCSDDETTFSFWGQEPVSGEVVLREEAAAAPKPTHDLEERATRFGKAIVRFARKIQRGPATNRLIDQLVGAGTSIGANYVEAKDGVSRKDFKNRVGTSRKESKETMFFLRMVAAADGSLAPEARLLWREAKELNLIFGAIWRK
jgi:four helix bundle protein